MFDFEKLDVYQRCKSLNVDVIKELNRISDVDLYLKDQIKRATLSIAFNIAEGVGRTSMKDRRRFYVIGRSSCQECVAILQMVYELSSMSEESYKDFYSRYEVISKMLYRLIKASS